MYLHHRVSLVLLSFTVAVAASAYPEYRVTVVGPADSWVYGINNAGVVVGDYAAGGDRRRAFLNRGKGLVDLGALTGVWSSASGINDRGEVVGNWRSADGRQRGFIYACGKARDIGTIPDKVTGYSDINDAGYITASGRNPATGETLGYLRAPNGAFTHLGAIDWDGNGAPETVPAALNNRNQITGRSGRFNSPEPGYRAFVWKNGAIRDLGRPGFDAQHRTRDQRPRPDYRPGVPARRPPPRQHRQWEHIHPVATARACLAVRVPAIHHDDLTAAPRRLVLQLAVQLTRSHVSDCPRQATISEHALHVQVFNANGVEAASNIRAQLM